MPRTHQQITNIVYSEAHIGVNENFNILEYWLLKRADPNSKKIFNYSEVERDISSFEMASTHLRTRLSDDIIIKRDISS